MIFVTGGTGLVGAHLLFDLISSGKKVKALKRVSSNTKQVLKIFSFYSDKSEQLFNKIEWVNGDILDHYSLEDALNGATEVYHCAAIVSFDPSDRKKMITNNVEGTANLVNVCIEKNISKLCYVSSVAALGKQKGDEPITEETNWIPSKKHSGYSESKFFSETEIWRGIEEGLDCIIVNPSIILGPGNWNDGSPKLFKTVNDGLKFYTKGVTGYVAVTDVTKVMVALMGDTRFENCKNQRFLLSAENISFHEIFQTIAKSLGKPAPRYFASDFLMGVAWRLIAIVSLLTFKKPLITRDTAMSANNKNYFDGSKISDYVDFTYQSISETIQKTSSFFKSEKNT